MVSSPGHVPAAPPSLRTGGGEGQLFTSRTDREKMAELPQGHSGPEAPGPEWQRIAGLLNHYREQQQRDWHGIDEAVLARLLLGSPTDQDHAQIEQARRQSPRVLRCLAMIEDVLGPGLPAPGS